jgi:hypothetical protein
MTSLCVTAPRLGPRVPLVLLLVLASACGDPVEPDDVGFGLTAADGPVELLLGEGVLVSSGTLTVEGSAITQRLTLRCRDDAPGCSLPGGWGHLTGAIQGPVGPGGGQPVTWSDTRQAMLRVQADTAWVSHPIPVHLGLGTVALRFER